MPYGARIGRASGSAIEFLMRLIKEIGKLAIIALIFRILE
jgi:hypothetical protein